MKQDLLAAMKRRDRLVTSVLRMAEAAFANEVIAQGHELERAAEIKLIQKLIKQRQEAASFFETGGKPEAADQERAEIKILEAYLPAELSDEELRHELTALIEKLAIHDMADFGRLMAAATKQMGDRAGGQRIAELARTLLNDT